MKNILLIVLIGFSLASKAQDTLHNIKYVYVSEKAPDTLTFVTLKPVHVRLIGDFYPIHDFPQPHNLWDITNEEYARVLLWRNQEDLQKRKNRKP